jgi:hypothetical protein
MKKKSINVDINSLPATAQVAAYYAQIHELRGIGMRWGFIRKVLVESEAVGNGVKLPAFICAVKKNKYAGVIAQKRLAELDRLFEKVVGDSHDISNTEKRGVGRPVTLSHLSAEERLERMREQWKNATIKFRAMHKNSAEKAPSKLADLSAEERLERLKKQRRESYERSRDSAKIV